MKQDPTESTDSNPIIDLLEKNNALDLISQETSCLYPQIWGLCEFERKGIGYIGKYESPDKPINIKYETYQTSEYEDVLTCEASATLKYWTDWQNKFPKDFILALVFHSPFFQIFQQKEITLFQQFVFKDTGIERHVTLIAQIYNKDETLTVCKIDNGPTTVTPQEDFWKIAYYIRDVSRQQ